MTLVEKLKSLLGLSGSSPRGRDDPAVTVEREPDSVPEPSAESEAAVKGTDDGPAAEGTDAAASTGSLVDEEAAEEPDTAAESAEAESPEGVEGPGDGDEPAQADGTNEGGEEPDDDVSVQEITGIGPAYAERLAGIGIETVAELAAADPDDIAEGVDGVGTTRAEQWVERATEYGE